MGPMVFEKITSSRCPAQDLCQLFDAQLQSRIFALSSFLLITFEAIIKVRLDYVLVIVDGV